jgi:hypothetical protein
MFQHYSLAEKKMAQKMEVETAEAVGRTKEKAACGALAIPNGPGPCLSYDLRLQQPDDCALHSGGHCVEISPAVVLG